MSESNKKTNRLGVIVGLIILGVIIFWIYSSWYVWGPLRHNRAAMSGAYRYAKEISTLLEKDILSGNKVDYKITSPYKYNFIKNVNVGQDGTITVYLSKTEASLMLIPNITNGNVKWKCNVSDINLSPSSCR